MRKIIFATFFCFAIMPFIALAQKTDSAKTVTITATTWAAEAFKSSDPLIIIDGNKQLIRGTASLSAIDPKLIESVEVLKDSSATLLYGIDGSSGVIIIKTKQGKSNLRSLSIPKNLSDADVKSKVTGMSVRPAYLQKKM